MTKPPLFARRRQTALCGASLSALILAIATPQPATAQSFQGTGTVTSGTASISTGAGTTDVFVGSGEVIIDWRTTSAGSNVVFQPAGTTSTFQDSGFSGPTNYTVLNRIVPVDGSGAPTSATVEFDGTVNSTLFGQVGGNVWFYSPNGVILGPTATFNVGGLVLTTNPIDTTGGLYGPSGQIRFAGPAGSLAPVTIQSGARINALRNAQLPSNDVYVALVAPRIEQAGTVRSDGSIAYVAAEVADITINAGLFDITVTTGTTDPNGLVHTGTTGGSASASASDIKTIYMVAMGKNDGLTMLLNGGIGYDAAALATDDGSAVVLSAGHGLGFDAGDPRTATASIAIGDAQFSSVTTARATDTITVAPTDTTVFDRFATLDAVNRVELNALGGAQIIANDTLGVPSDILFPPFGTRYSLDVSAGYAEQGGTIAINVDGGGALTAAGRLRLRAIGDGSDTAALSLDGIGGTIGIDLVSGSIGADALEIDASGYGGDVASGTGGDGTGGSVSISSAGSLSATGLTIDATGNGGSGDIGGGGIGGAIRLDAPGGTIIAPFMNLNASGSGGFALNQGGAGTGGTIDITASAGGILGNGTSLFATASGYGGSSDVLGGNGIGGGVTMIDNGGLLDFSGVFLDANGVGSYSDGNGGNGFGGTILVALNGNDQNWNNLFLDANGEGGESFGGGISGSATADLANGVRLEVTGAALNVANSVTLSANAYAPVNGSTGSFGRAGSAVIDVSAGGALTTGSDVTVRADADFNIEGLGSEPNFTPDMTGGNAALLIDNGSVSVPSLSVEAYGVSMGALTGAGSATGGTAQVSVANNGSLVVDSTLGSAFTPGLNVIASATGAYETSIGSTFGTVTDGFAATATGGSASLLLSGGTIDVADAVMVEAQGHGGPSSTIGGADSLGSGTGGTALVAISGGTMTLASTLDILAEGFGGTIKGGATGGSGTGGVAALDVSGGALFANAGGGVSLTISADGTSNDVDPAESGSSGAATGGQAGLRGAGGNVTVAGTTLIRARGLSGAAGINGTAGDATGGLALLASENGSTLALNGPVSVLANALGGAGTLTGALGGNAFGGSASAGQTGTGTTTISGGLLVDASASGGANSTDSLVQGRANGGSAGLTTEGGALQVIGNVTLDAGATGGTNPGGTPPPTIAGLLKIGSSAADPSGTLDVSGALDASATGATAAAGGQGLTLRTANAALSVTGDATITVTGDAAFDVLGSGSFDTGGALAITSAAGQVTGSGLLSSGSNMLISGAAGISLGSLDSGGTTSLTSASGPVTVADLLSTGPVTVSGLSVSIGSSGSLTFADADATGGDLSLNVADNLVVATVDAAGAVTLSSTNGPVAMNGAVHGAGITIAAGTDASANADLASSGALSITAGGTFASTGLVTAAGNVSISADLGISMPGLSSGGTTLLRSVGGPVSVSQFDSAGLVTALGRSVDITSTGVLSFVSADATGGDLTILTTGGLVLGSGSATGAAQFTSSGGSIAFGGPLSAASVVIDAALDASLADVSSAGLLNVTAGNNLTGTGTITAGGPTNMSAGGALTLLALGSGGATQLLAGGALNVADLNSAGLVTARGTSVGIVSTGGLAFADADAAAGNLSIRTQGNLDLATVDAAGSITLAGLAGSVANSGAVNGAGIIITAGQDISAGGDLNASGTMTLGAGRNLTLNGNALAAGALGMTAGQTITINALASGSQIAAASQDIVIGTAGQMGQRGTTASVGFTNSNGANTSYIGGAAATGGYSLDNAELQQVFADNALAFAVRTSTGAGEVQVGALGLGFGTGQAIGSGGTLSLATPGRISIVGNVGLFTSGALDTLDLTAANVEVSTDLGSITLTDGSGNPLGLLRVTAGRFVTATSGTIAQLDPSLGLRDATALLDTPGVGPTRGALFAGAIEADVTDAFYVQNLGASAEYAGRRGFTTGSLAITTAGPATRIAINGVIIDATGNQATGLDTVSAISINGSAAAAGGPFNPLSTVNGCVIGLPCGLLTNGGLDDVLVTKADIQRPVSPEDPAGGLLTPPVIEMDVDLPALQRNATLPLVDEPVTGVGNEDLWGNSCSPGEEGCVGGQTK
ncbi:MAG TPA: hypothetical protein VJQ77_05510 [Novosphingobium sp.]|nr:hypothetical protein [Novosphingobium sp.]